jgi:hypothetical protein
MKLLNFSNYILSLMYTTLEDPDWFAVAFAVGVQVGVVCS